MADSIYNMSAGKFFISKEKLADLLAAIIKEWVTSDPGMITGGEVGIECVVPEDLERMLSALKVLAKIEGEVAEAFYEEMKKKYATEPMLERLDGS